MDLRREFNCAVVTAVNDTNVYADVDRYKLYLVDFIDITNVVVSNRAYFMNMKQRRLKCLHITFGNLYS